MADFQLQEKKRPIGKGRADVMFVIDRSRSMTPVLEGLIEHLASFVQAIESNPNQQLDWRIGFVAQDNREFVCKEFSNSVRDLVSALKTVRLGGNEATMLAIDYASSVEWREDATRIVSIFTDEPLRGGNYYRESRAAIDAMAEKLNQIKAYVFLFSPEDTDYKRFSQLLHRSQADFKQDFNSISFEQLLKNMGKTVSQMASQQTKKAAPPLVFAKLIRDSITITHI